MTMQELKRRDSYFALDLQGQVRKSLQTALANDSLGGIWTGRSRFRSASNDDRHLLFDDGCCCLGSVAGGGLGCCPGHTTRRGRHNDVGRCYGKRITGVSLLFLARGHGEVVSNGDDDGLNERESRVRTKRYKAGVNGGG